MIALILAAALDYSAGPRPGRVCTIAHGYGSDCDFWALKGKAPKGYVEIPASAVHCLPDGQASISNLGGSVGDMFFESLTQLNSTSVCGSEVGHVWLLKSRR